MDRRVVYVMIGADMFGAALLKAAEATMAMVYTVDHLTSSADYFCFLSKWAEGEWDLATVEYRSVIGRCEAPYISRQAANNCYRQLVLWVHASLR